MIREHDTTSSLIERTEDLSETSLHIATEAVLVIAREVRSIREDIVWRIEVDEVSLLCLIEDMLEALDLYLCLGGIQELGYIGNILFLDVIRILVGSHRYVELSTTIDAVESVEACTIEIDESSSTRDITIFFFPSLYPIPCTDF
jgi:hypothetical protein